MATFQLFDGLPDDTLSQSEYQLCVGTEVAAFECEVSPLFRNDTHGFEVVCKS